MPTPHFIAPKPAVDLDTLQAIIDYRYDVLAKYAKSLRRTYAKELDRRVGSRPVTRAHC